MLKRKGVPYLSLILISLFAITGYVEAILPRQQQTQWPVFSLTPDVVVHDLDLWPVFEALEANRDMNCVMPCWWGLRPGSTTIDEVIDFLRQTGFDRHKQRTIYRSIPMETYLRGGEPFGLRFEAKRPRLSSFEMHFVFDDNNLLGTFVQFTNPGNWLPPTLDRFSLGRILAQFPESPELYLSTDENHEVDFRLIHLLLISDEIGVNVSYYFNDQRPTEDEAHLQLCLGIQETKYINLTLEDPVTVSQNIRDEIEPVQGSGFRRLEEVFGIDTETFIQYFRDYPDGCLDISEYKTQ